MLLSSLSLLTRALELGRVATASHVGVELGQLGGGGGGAGPHPGHAEGGEGAPGRGDGVGLGEESEVDLHLPALVHLRSAAVTTGGPGAVGDPDEIGASKYCTVGIIFCSLPPLLLLWMFEADLPCHRKSVAGHHKV